MQVWSAFPFLRYTIWFATGILYYIHIDDSHANAIEWLFSFLLLFVIIQFVPARWNPDFQVIASGIISGGTLFMFGYVFSSSRDEVHMENHITKQHGRIEAVSGQVIGVPREKVKTHKLEFRIDKALVDGGWKPVSGTCYLYVPKASQRFGYGDRLLVYSHLRLIEGPSNPSEFDYKRYCRFNHIYHQVYALPEQVAKIGDGGNPLVKLSLRARSRLDSVFRKYIDGDHEYAIVTALVLGVKDHLNNDIVNSYSAAGAMHVLAVSGLHVGILFKLLSLLMQPIKSKRKFGFVSGILVIFILWFYAFVTGMSASVLRSVTMFSLMSLAGMSGRDSNIFNTLSLAAFCMLMFDPFMIMEVGFQLSFLAVGGIVYIHPKLYGLWMAPSKALDWVWNITCVSLAAQIATFPIGLLYFHQFPTLFLLSNLFVIPLGTFILIGALFVLILSWIPSMAIVVAFVVEKLTTLLNWGVFTSEGIPYSLITGIDISVLESWLVYALIIFAFVFLEHKKIRWLIAAVGVSLILSAININEVLQQKSQRMCTFYSVKNSPAIGILSGNEIMFIADKSLLNDEDKLRFHVYHDWWHKNLWRAEKKGYDAALSCRVSIPGVGRLWNIAGKQILMVDTPMSRDIIFDKAVRVDIVYLQGRSVKGVQGICTAFNPKWIVADHSFSDFYLKKFSFELAGSDTRLHALGKDGAFNLAL